VTKAAAANSSRGNAVEGLSGLLRAGASCPSSGTGVWLFADWMDLPADTTDVTAVAEVVGRRSSA
jgi:S-adenosylmethionine-dependent methyltransferase